MTNILLLRAPSEISPDPYESVLRDSSYNPYSIPVLETSFTNLPTLQDLIAASPRSREYAGIIITSKRSCEAWTTAVKNLFHSPEGNNDISLSSLTSSIAAWTKVPFYVVGKGTASTLEEFQTTCNDLGIPSSLDIRGETTGTGEQLAHFILDDLKQHTPGSVKTLLYLTGDKNRDTVPKILSSNEGRNHGVEIETIQVYETHGASNFESSLDSLLQRVGSGDWWIVFFAPSSSVFTYPFLQKHFRFKKHESTLMKDEINSALESQKPLARVGAIGRVTSTYLEEEMLLYVDAVAVKPTPEALLAAISTSTMT